MSREDHQPLKEIPERPRRSGEELRAVCGRSVTYILAFGEGAEEHIETVLTEAIAAKVPAVFILTDPASEQAVAQAVYSARRKGKNTVVEVMGVDPVAVRELTRNAADFELYGVPFGLLVTMRELSVSVLPNYRAVLVMDARMCAITAGHLYELHEDMDAYPDCDAITSWIQQLRRPPYLISRAYLESLDDAPYTKRTLEGNRPLPHISIRDHVFGEEKLAAPAVEPAGLASFFEQCTMSALQVVQLAKWVQEHPDETPVSLNQSQPLSSADQKLLEIALDVLKRGDTFANTDADIVWADEFGQCNKRDFPLLNDPQHADSLVYLDSAATSQRLGAALQAQSNFDLHENANVYRGAYPLSAQATASLNDARKRLEDFIGSERRSTVYCMNTSAACNLVAQAWGEWNIGEGDLILTTIAEHHSNTMPFALLAERKGATLEYLPVDAAGRIDQEAYKEALSRHPKLVAIAHIGNVLGIMNPVREMADAAHKVGARFMLDCAQSFPHHKVRVDELGVDWVAISAHKAYGPFGIGALWISDEAFDEMDPLAAGGGVISHTSTESYYLRPKAPQYEPGTLPISQAIGWAAAIDYLDSLGMDNVERHAAACTRYVVNGLRALEGVNVVGDHSAPDGQTGLVSFTVRSVAPGELARFLGKLGVAIRSGGHCALPIHATMGLIGTGRISVAAHTTRDDLDAALVAIEACRSIYEA